MAANNIYIQVDFNSQGAQQNVNALNQAIAQTGPTSQKSSAQATQSLQSVSVSVQQVTRSFGELATALAGLGIARTVGSMVQVGAEITRIQTAMAAFAGSTADAQKVFDQVRAIAAQGPFRFKDLEETARLLLGFGMAAKDVPTTLKAISDQVASMGGSIESVNNIVRLFGRIMEKDFVGAMDLMRSLPQQGVPVMKALREELSKSLNITATTEDVKAAIKEGILDPLQTVRVVTENIGRQKAPFADAETAFKNLGDAIQYATAELFGPNGFGPALANLAREMQTVLAPVAGVIKYLEQLPESTKETIVNIAAIGAAVVAAAGAFAALAAVFGPLIGVIASFIGLLPEILTVVGALAGIGYVLYKESPLVQKFVEGTKKQFDDLVKAGAEFTKAMDAALHPEKMAKSSILSPEAQEELFKKLLLETQQTATAAQSTLLQALASPAEAVEIKYSELFAKLEEKLKFLNEAQKQGLRDVLRSGETAELDAARFRKQKEQIDEVAKYQLERTKGSYEAQIAYIEAQDEQDLTKKVAAIDKVTDLREQSARAAARIEDQALTDTFNEQARLIEANRAAYQKAGIDVDEMVFNLHEEMLRKQGIIDQKAVDEAQKYRLEGWKKANDAIIEDQKRVYEAFKSEFDQLFDAFTDRTKSLGQALGDFFKKLALGELKETFSSQMAAIATQEAGYGRPEETITRGQGILGILLRRGMPPRPPGAPPGMYVPGSTEEGIKYGGVADSVTAITPPALNAASSLDQLAEAATAATAALGGGAGGEALPRAAPYGSQFFQYIRGGMGGAAFGGAITQLPPPSQAEAGQLAEIRRRESTGNYGALNIPLPGQRPSTASGAYQMIDATWKEMAHATGIGEQYEHARDAPKWMQDANALFLLRQRGTKPWASTGPYPSMGATAAAGTSISGLGAANRTAVCYARGRPVSLLCCRASFHAARDGPSGCAHDG